MSSIGDRILEQALHLPVSERARVAAELIASIDARPDADAELAWAAEVEHRARRALAGDSAGKDWEAVCQRISDKIAK